MIDWAKHWAAEPAPEDRNDYLKQVGHTVHGKSIGDSQFQLMVEQVFRELSIARDDTVLDLCCGNGYLTQALAGHCKKIVGVDFSEQLLEIARSDNCPANAGYFQMDVLNLNLPLLTQHGPFNKILLFAALQHFKRESLSGLLSQFVKLADPKPIILIGFVPDRARRSAFYDTPERQRERIRRILAGTDPMGTWWKKTEIEAEAEAAGLTCTFHSICDGLHAANYRFNAVLRRG